MTTPEVIAKLDALEREFDRVRLQLRTLRQELVESLDEIDRLW